MPTERRSSTSQWSWYRVHRPSVPARQQSCRWRKAFPEAGKIVNLYGPTETTLAKCFYEIPDNVLSGVQPIGFSLPESQALILAEDSQMCGIGELGEIVLRTPFRSLGYVNASQENQKRFVKNYFGNDEEDLLYYTGDRGRYRPDGSLDILGRIDYQVKINGIRIEPEEIETVLVQYPAVQQTVVIAREDKIGNKRLIAYVVSEDDSLSRSQLKEFLRQQLPNYMMPKEFIILKNLPLTPNGKVDRFSLIASIQEKVLVESKKNFVPPRTFKEKIFADIWAEILGCEQISVHDNFFELGGDSILSIRVVAKASQAGLSITPKLIFQNQTLVKQAAVAKTACFQSEQNLVEGYVPLLPIQQAFLEHNVLKPHLSFNQAILLKIQQNLNLFVLEKSLMYLFIHHDALRLKFSKEGTFWRQKIVGFTKSPLLTCIDLSMLPKIKQKYAVENTRMSLQTNLQLSKEPLMRVVFLKFNFREPNYLLIIIHHLISDAISKQLILDDLQTVYEKISLNRNHMLQLLPKTTSFKVWAERLAQHAQSDKIKQELTYWLAISKIKFSSFPVDFPDNIDCNTKLDKLVNLSTSLKIEDVLALRKQLTSIYNTSINDVLLAALVEAFVPWTGSRSLLVKIAGHGRKQIFEDLDVSRTVGWLSIFFPLYLNLERATSREKALLSVREQVISVPNQGIGYGLLRYMSEQSEIREQLSTIAEPQVSFNYLGRKSSKAESSKFCSDDSDWLYTKQIDNPQSKKRKMLRLSVFFKEDSLQLDWFYSEMLYRRSTIESLAQGYIQAIRSFI